MAVVTVVGNIRSSENSCNSGSSGRIPVCIAAVSHPNDVHPTSETIKLIT